SIIAQAQSRLAGQSIEKLYKLIQEARHIIPQKGKTFRLVSNKETVLAELWDWAKKMISLPIENRKSASLICYLRKDVQGIVRAFKTNFPKLRIKEYHDKSDLEEKAHDFSNLLNAKRECLSRELQNRGIFPDIDSVIQNKDVLTIRLWVAFILEKFQPIPKSEENVVSLSQVVKENSSIVKVEEISDVSNATIVDRETAEFLENKPRKTLEEMRSLDRHHIFRAYRQLRDANTNNRIAVEVITRKDYRDDKLA
ncbi:2614_t:CDS:2, partial [Funneliformis geosporum]